MFRLMGSVKVSAESPAELSSWTSVQDGWQSFANTLYGPNFCWEIVKGKATSSCGVDNQITSDKITFTTKGAFPTQTTLTGKFKFRKRQKEYPFLEIRGIVKGYESKVFASGTWYEGDGYTLVKASGLKTKIDKILSKNLERNSYSSTPEYTGDSFISDGIINYSKNINLTSNIASFSPTRSIGKTTYSIIDSPGQSRGWQLKLGNSKDTIDLTQIGSDDLKIFDFDLKKDKIILEGDYFTMMQPGAYEGIKLYSGQTKIYQGMTIPGDNSRLLAEFKNSGVNGSIIAVDNLDGIKIKTI